MLQVNIVLHINHADPILEIMKVYFIKKFSFIISYRYDFYSENCKNLGDFSNFLSVFAAMLTIIKTVSKLLSFDTSNKSKGIPNFAAERLVNRGI